MVCAKTLTYFIQNNSHTRSHSKCHAHIKFTLQYKILNLTQLWGLESTEFSTPKSTNKDRSINWQDMVQDVKQIILLTKWSIHIKTRQIHITEFQTGAQHKPYLSNDRKLLRAAQTFGSPCCCDNGLIKRRRGRCDSTLSGAMSYTEQSSQSVM